MQIKILFNLDEPVRLPLNYSKVVHNFIYHSLIKSPYYTVLPSATATGNAWQSFNLYCFGPLGGRDRTVDDRQLLFKNSMSLEIRSPVPLFIQTLLSVLTEGQPVWINGQRLEVSRVRLLEQRINESEVRLKILMPLLIYSFENNQAHSYDPGELDYYETVNKVFQKKFLRCFSQEAAERIMFTPLYVHPQHDKCPVVLKNIQLTAWRGSYVLQGRPEYLDFLYNTGLGMQTTHGYGFWERDIEPATD